LAERSVRTTGRMASISIRSYATQRSRGRPSLRYWQAPQLDNCPRQPPFSILQNCVSVLAVAHADDHLPYRAVALHDPMCLRNVRHVEYAMDGDTHAPGRDVVEKALKDYSGQVRRLA